MRKDIAGRDDVELLVNSFYEVVRADGTVGYIFHDIIGEDWSHHLPIMYQFWESVLLQKPGYTGNPVKKHIDIDKKIPLNKEHFNRWLEIWNATVDRLFEGPIADDAKNRGMLMANMLDMKIVMARDAKFIS